MRFDYGKHSKMKFIFSWRWIALKMVNFGIKQDFLVLQMKLITNIMFAISLKPSIQFMKNIL